MVHVVSLKLFSKALEECEVILGVLKISKISKIQEYQKIPEKY